VETVKAGEDSVVSDRHWYALHTYSGFENKVKFTIERVVEQEKLADHVHRIVIPLEPVIELKNGKKHTVMRNLMPGYLLIEIDALDDLFNLIKDVKGVSGFVGGGTKPAPLPQAEVDNILGHMESKADKPKPEITYQKGDQVKVTEGPFANFVGAVDHVDKEKNKLSVMVSIFGRPTPVELDVLQVEPA